MGRMLEHGKVGYNWRMTIAFKLALMKLARRKGENLNGLIARAVVNYYPEFISYLPKPSEPSAK